MNTLLDEMLELKKVKKGANQSSCYCRNRSTLNNIRHSYDCRCQTCKAPSPRKTLQDEMLDEFEISNWEGLNKAKRLNFCMKNWLGWGGTNAEKRKYEKKIKKFLEDENYSDPFIFSKDPHDDFALAIRSWQISTGLVPDGIIGLKTLNYFSSILDLNLIDRLTPEVPSWIEKASPQSIHFSKRGKMDITHIIYHATGGSNSPVKYFQKNSRHVSPHFVIEKSGKIIQMVPLNKSAHHAGESRNRYSIGIEIVNNAWLRKKGEKWVVKKKNKSGKVIGKKTKKCAHKYCTAKGREYTGTPISTLSTYYRKSRRKWDPYNPKQYYSLIKLTTYLLACINTIKHITGHEHIVKSGKRADPGGAFDWNRIRRGIKNKWKRETSFNLKVNICDKSAINPKTKDVDLDATNRIIIPVCKSYYR